jgi:hypothetical protein
MDPGNMSLGLEQRWITAGPHINFQKQIYIFFKFGCASAVNLVSVTDCCAISSCQLTFKIGKSNQLSKLVVIMVKLLTVGVPIDTTQFGLWPPKG